MAANVNLAAKTAAALLEYDRLGRLSDKTRDDLADALGDQAGGRIVEVDDTAPSTSKGASK